MGRMGRTSHKWGTVSSSSSPPTSRPQPAPFKGCQKQKGGCQVGRKPVWEPNSGLQRAWILPRDLCLGVSCTGHLLREACRKSEKNLPKPQEAQPREAWQRWPAALSLPGVECAVALCPLTWVTTFSPCLTSLRDPQALWTSKWVHWHF